MIEQFLKWLKQERNVSTSTCNQRLAAIHAFFRYVQYEHPERTVLCQQVLFLKFAKAPKTELNYMSIEGVQALLAIPNTATANGRRELAILVVRWPQPYWELLIVPVFLQQTYSLVQS